MCHNSEIPTGLALGFQGCWTTGKESLSVPRLSTAVESTGAPPQVPRITSIDALRGLVMFTMIFVNDIAGVSPNIVPPWMRHFKGKSGMTFVVLVAASWQRV